MKIAKFFLLVGLVFCEGALCVPASYAADIRMFVHHEVADYATWRKSYDAFDTTRKALGVTGQAVYQTIDNPNDVTVTHDFASIEKAKSFASSPELKAAMSQGGVKSAPQVWFTKPSNQ